MRIQWRYQPCPCLLAGGLASIWEAVSPLFSTPLVVLTECKVKSTGTLILYRLHDNYCICLLHVKWHFCLRMMI